jgi:hypothetical protein
MAQAGDHPTPIKELDDLVDYLTENLRCTKVVAVCVMNEAYSAGDLWLEKQDLIGDGEPYGDWIAVHDFGHLKPDSDGHVQVVTKLWRKARYRIAEQCDARAIWPAGPPASQAAPDQQPKGKVPDQSKTAAAPAPVSDPSKRMSTQEWVTAEAIRLIKANKIPPKEKKHISHFAQLLEKAEVNKSSPDPIGWLHIKNMLPKWQLWPVESIPSKFPDAFRDA